MKINPLHVGLLSLIMAFPVVAQTATVPSGSGTSTDPYQIATLDNLYWLSQTDSIWNDSLYFVQTADIDASPTSLWNSGSGVSPIGSGSSAIFIGNYNGRGHTITGLCIRRPSSDYIGLFGFTRGARIDSLGLVDANITGGAYVGGVVGYNNHSTVYSCYITGSVTGSSYVGGVVGNNYYSSTVSHSSTTGSVTGADTVGGVVGFNYSSSTVSHSSTTGSVTGAGNCVGGVVGYNYRNSSAHSCYNTSSVTGSSYVGGVVGINFPSCTTSHCYNTGSVTGIGHDVGGVVGGSHYWSMVSTCYNTGSVTGNSFVGGVVGGNSVFSPVRYCYNTGSVTGADTVGGVAGYSYPDGINYCYWNIEISGQTSGSGYPGGPHSSAIGLTTAQMKNSVNLSNLGSFYTLWTIRIDSTYAGLQAQGVSDNAPFAFADTFSSNRTFSLSNLLLNDCDIETKRANLILKIQSMSTGTTDSISILTFGSAIPNGTTDTIFYRVGEIRSSKNDTLWGNIATSYVTLDTNYQVSVKPASSHILPAGLSLSQSSNIITFSLPISTSVSLHLFDLRGRHLATLINNEFLPAGYHARSINGAAAIGVFVYRLRAGDKTIIRKSVR